MPPSDQEPRYRLVDSNGNVVGALWGDGNGNVKIADETNTQTTFGPNGISTPALETDKADTRSGYVDVASSRALGTTETNNTGSDLDVSVLVIASADGTQTNVQMEVDGVKVDSFAQVLDTQNYASLSCTVPNGSDYVAKTFGVSADTADYDIADWVEQQ